MTEKVKIAYNACYGGFSLSREAVLLARSLSGDPNWGGATIAGDKYEDGTPVLRDYGFVEGVSRADPFLIQAIERLGDGAGGSHSKLAIAEIPKGSKYRIDEYDGWESVKTPDDYDWEIAS